LQEKNKLDNGGIGSSQALRAKLSAAGVLWAAQARAGGLRLIAQANQLAARRGIRL
jgi:hypothetical protein